MCLQSSYDVTALSWTRARRKPTVAASGPGSAFLVTPDVNLCLPWLLFLVIIILMKCHCSSCCITSQIYALILQCICLHCKAVGNVCYHYYWQDVHNNFNHCKLYVALTAQCIYMYVILGRQSQHSVKYDCSSRVLWKQWNRLFYKTYMVLTQVVTAPCEWCSDFYTASTSQLTDVVRRLSEV